MLESYIAGRWVRGSGDGTPLLDAATGATVATVGVPAESLRVAVEFGRDVGGPALRALTFHQRAGLLKDLIGKLEASTDEFHELSFATGATRSDSSIDIDGGFATVRVFASKGKRELPNARVLLDGDVEALGRHGTFVGRHVYNPRRGVAVFINAFNFPVWGMLEKLAPCFLAGVPAIVKPATQTAYLAERVFRRMVESGCLPEGSVQLVSGPVGDLLDHLGGQDMIAFTGSATTAARLRRTDAVAARSTHFTAEADSLNFSMLGPEAGPGTREFDLYVQEVVRETTIKAGQRCTAIRRALVPAAHVAAVEEALVERFRSVRVGDPRAEATQMGALASLAQRDEVRRNVGALGDAGTLVCGGLDEPIDGADTARGAFLGPVLVRASDAWAPALHEVEAFGPVCSLIPYGSLDDAARLAAAGSGSLVGSLFTADRDVAATIVNDVAPYHGRLLVVDETSARESTGHGTPLAHLVHGGPGRAGGGEELGGVRGVLHYLQRTAIQGSPDVVTRVTGQWVVGAATNTDGPHPFRKHLEDLQVGDSIRVGPKTITVDDIEHFADFTGDRFYAHTDDAAAAKNPLFGGRVAHGYYIVSLAAGLFVDPDPGPVLANYGLDKLRFLTPVHPGDELSVTLTCKHKNPRETEPYGEVTWDVDVTSQDGTSVARYDVLTLVATRGHGV